MNESIVEYRTKPAGATNNPTPREGAQQYLNAAIVSQTTHEIQGAFFSVASVGAMIKLAIENGEETKLLLDHFMDACQTFKYKLSNFLEYARFNAGLRDIRLELVNLKPLLTRIVNESQVLADEKNLKISLLISEEIPGQLLSDEFRLALICTNLVSNAIKSSLDESSVSISVKTEDDANWSIAIEDKGEGMTMEKLKVLFNPLPWEKMTPVNSAGLGLIVTRYLVEDLLGGKLSVTSQLQVGTTCKILLPLNNSLIPLG